MAKTQSTLASGGLQKCNQGQSDPVTMSIMSLESAVTLKMNEISASKVLLSSYIYYNYNLTQACQLRKPQ